MAKTNKKMKKRRIITIDECMTMTERELYDFIEEDTVEHQGN